MNVIEGMKEAAKLEQRDYDERAHLRREVKEMILVRLILRVLYLYVITKLFSSIFVR